jgi:hypothetical protein
MKTMILFNKARRREGAVAKAMTGLLLSNCVNGQPVARETYAHYFGLACEQQAFMPNAKSMGRILKMVEEQVGNLNRAGDRLIKRLNKSTDKVEALR